MINYMADSIWINVFRRDLNKHSFIQSALLGLELKVLDMVLEVGARFRHWVRQLFLIVEPVAIISE